MSADREATIRERLEAEIQRADRRGEEITAETLRAVEAELAAARRENESMLQHEARYEEELAAAREQVKAYSFRVSEMEEALQRIAALNAYDNGEMAKRLAAAALPPVRSTHAAEEHIPERVVAHRESLPAAISDGVVAGGLNDPADPDEFRAFHAPDRDLNPVADGEHHHSIVTGNPTLSYGDVRCGICGQTTGCDCMSLSGSEGRGNREHLSSALAAGPPGPEVYVARPCDADDCPNIATDFDAWGYWCNEHNGGAA